ncbi:M20/M25/M40 family metallo-hydrolase [Desulfobacter curvatus]|uniref:M20/M25/M40 family metallo-hydrolase n=1 Tax=Desulfobacter curvatus TaxID=2290 RepID=UPI0012FC69D3|nr:M20/M25/M40 family metallo-hydrolase [Desulfobacter curvatus]
MPEFIHRILGELPYFQQYPDHIGAWNIKNDHFKRRVAWAMIRGGSTKTIVLMHHFDVVVIDNYGPLKHLALDIERLEAALKEDASILTPDAKKDLESGNWIFGRGAADMKGGGAIQLALFDTYARLSDQERRKLPTLVLLAVPDEENMSAGMRAATGLLCRLREKWNLDYELMINSEPHQRRNSEKGLISQGSIGKLNVFVYVRGVTAHAGKVLEGLNATGIMAQIVARTDLSEEFVDQVGNQAGIHPTWMRSRDLKKNYDISFPEACYGIFNVLTFNTGPDAVLNKMTTICREILSAYQERVNQKREILSRQTGRNLKPFDWAPCVMPFGDLKDATPAPDKDLEITEELGFRTAAFNLESPMVIVGFCPPYYPGVTNPDQATLHNMVTGFTQAQFGQEYDNEAYFTGICDLSYAMMADDPKILSAALAHMAGNDGYHIAFDEIEKISMDCINIGPWGLDYHKPSERVFKEDLLERTPRIIDHVIRTYNIIRD